MFRILVITIILVASINAEQLSCYLCIGSLTSDCFNGVESSMVIQQCQEIGGSLEAQCVSYTATFPTNGENYIERGCGYMYANVDICEIMGGVDPNYPITDCSTCSTGLCNDGVFLTRL